MPTSAGSSPANRDSTFIERLTIGAGPLRVAVKDIIDVEGTCTTAGCLAVEAGGTVADRDAPLMAGIRAAVGHGTARIVGKTNLHELAFGATGINPAYGTSPNPLDATRVPGGSSSGSGSALASDGADVALGSDTGGSIRMPAACCGVVGLKTTWGRVPLAGVWPLAPFLDTIGPMARTVADAVIGMDLLEGGFASSVATQQGRTFRIGRVRPAVDVEPAVDDAVDHVLRTAAHGPVELVEIDAPLWTEVHQAGLIVLLGEAYRSDRHLLEGSHAHLVGEAIRARLLLGAEISDAQLEHARSVRDVARHLLTEVFDRVDVLAFPSIPILAPRLDDAEMAPLSSMTRYANLIGLPALAVPLTLRGEHRRGENGHLRASVQLVGAADADALCCAVGEVIEAANAT